MPGLGPRIVVAGTSSGVGKTTVATGLMAALRRRGRRVASAKVGPDFIDPGYHALATGRPGRNLDAWICGEEVMGPLAARAAADADMLVVEGVMGMFDGAAGGGASGGGASGGGASGGASGDGATASTAHVARLLDAPVLLVVDASAMSGSVAALVHGFATFDPRIDVAGVVLNQVASPGHETMLREALEPVGVPVVGVLRRDPNLAWRDRHLGLVPVVEGRTSVRRSLDVLATAVQAGCDLDAVEALARAAPTVTVDEPPAAAPVGRARIAVAAGPAFSFVYPENLELLEQAGAELVAFDPLVAPALPGGTTALYAGGGFPEVYAERLAENRPLLADVVRRAAEGLVVWAECGGLLWLSATLDGHRLAGVVPAHGRMTERLTLGYRTATARRDTPLGPAGTEVRGHEFHYSTLEPAGDALCLSGRFGSGEAGYASPTLLASYLHVHLGAAPQLAERFVAAAAHV